MSDDIVDNKNSDSYDFKSAPNSMELLCMLKQIIFNLTQDNLEMSIEKTMKLLDLNFPYSNNLIISNLIYSAFYSKKDVNLLYINYLELIQAKEEEMNKNNLKIIQIFSDYIREIKSQESYYLIENMIERNLADPDIIKDIKSIYFAHHKLNNEIYELHFAPFWKQFNGNWKELSKNDWELHKQLIKEGVNPNEISKIIRSDELEKLQEISSQENFNFNQYIEPSLYERCSFINQKNVTLIDYAAFFGSVKCFKYLLINGAKVENTGKYAVAGGNEEIIHLCEQNHSTFEGAYETAIEFHQNDIFKYIYEKKLEKLDEKAQQNIFRNGKLQQSRFGNNNYYRSNYSLNNISNLGCICIKNGNTEIFLFLHENGMEINEYIIDETVRISNIYLIKYFLQNNYIPKNIIIFKSLLESFEIVQLLLEQKGIDINAKDIYIFYYIFILIILYFKILFGKYSNYLKQHLYMHLNLVA